MKISKIVLIFTSLIPFSPIIAMERPPQMGITLSRLPKDALTTLLEKIANQPFHDARAGLQAIRVVCRRFRDLINEHRETLFTVLDGKRYNNFFDAAQCLGLLGTVKQFMASNPNHFFLGTIDNRWTKHNLIMCDKGPNTVASFTRIGAGEMIKIEKVKGLVEEPQNRVHRLTLQFHSPHDTSFVLMFSLCHSHDANYPHIYDWSLCPYNYSHQQPPAIGHRMSPIAAQSRVVHIILAGNQLEDSQVLIEESKA